MKSLIPPQVLTTLKLEFGNHIEFNLISNSGDVNKSAQINHDKIKYFVKWNTSFVPGMYRAEVLGLDLLKRSKIFKIPEVVFVNETCLVLEWLELDQNLKSDKKILSVFGEKLAQLHQLDSPQYGLSDTNFIGTLAQLNHPHPVWSSFYWGQRLKPQMEIARRRGQLTDKLIDLMEELESKLDDLLPQNPKASLLHGDLWSGNWGVSTKGEIVIFDPAVYCGDREIDLAMSKLFGGFGNVFYNSYNQTYPLDKDYLTRVKIYQLYPIWVHYNLFGKTYLSQLESLLVSLI